METTFTPAETAILKAFYDDLVKNLGVTAQWPRLTLRNKAGNISLTLNDISTRPAAPECHLCGDAEYGLQPAKVVITHANGSVYKYDAWSCSDCRCPK